MVRPLYCVVLGLALATTPIRAVAASPAAESETAPRNPAAQAAYDRATALVRDGEYSEAVAEFDVASDLEPRWAEPVRARAEVFATLADMHKPSEAFLAQRADDLQRLLVLDPGGDAGARQNQIDTLRQDSREAQEIEQRRRKLTTPTFIFGSVAASILLAGVILYSMTTREFLEPTAYRQYRRDRAGIVLMAAGGVLLIPTITLGVLVGRQARNDAATRAFSVHAGRHRPALSIAPQFLRAGAGIGLHLRF